MNGIISFIAPDEDIKEWAEYYWDLGLPDTKITQLLKDHYNGDMYGLR
jgi:hypothetical protein